MAVRKNNNWEKEFDERFVAVKQYYGKDRPALLRDEFANEINLPNKVKEFIHSLLHQRDNEIREKIQKNRPGYTAWFRRWGQLPDQCKDDPNKLEDFLDNLVNMGYTKALDDLLTYLSTKEK